MQKKYTIKKGNHYSSPPHIRFHFGITKLKFKFKFSSDCIYPINDTDDYDINKVYGFSQTLHHQNSIRLGWTSSISQTGRIDLYKYIYNNGKRIPDYTPITTIDVEKWYEATIEIDELFKIAIFSIRDVETGFIICTASTRYECPKFKWGYYLGFYFGGDHVAEQDMTISVEKIE